MPLTHLPNVNNAPPTKAIWLQRARNRFIAKRNCIVMKTPTTHN